MITNGYTTQAEFKAFQTVRGGSSSTDTADDAVIDSIIEAVSRRIDELVGRRFWKNGTDEIRYFQTDDSYKVKIGDLGASPTTVSVDYSDNRTYTNLVAADWEAEPVNAALDGKPYTQIVIAPSNLTSAYFPTCRRGVKVTGKFGFPAVPADIKELCLEITLNVYQSRSGQSSAGNITITAAGVVIRPQDIPAAGWKTIEGYRNYL